MPTTLEKPTQETLFGSNGVLLDLLHDAQTYATTPVRIEQLESSSYSVVVGIAPNNSDESSQQREFVLNPFKDLDVTDLGVLQLAFSQNLKNQDWQLKKDYCEVAKGIKDEFPTPMDGVRFTQTTKLTTKKDFGRMAHRATLVCRLVSLWIAAQKYRIFMKGYVGDPEVPGEGFED